jgi:muramoyltetrapeptide carboxypeptidase
VSRLVTSRPLAPGSLVGIAAPAGPIDAATLAAGEAWLESLGFRCKRASGVLARRGYLAGDDAARAAQLHELWSDPDVGAIVCARGGYGVPRILDRLDAKLVRSARKPLVGYSDITALLLWQSRACGLTGIHGPMLERGSPRAAETGESLARALRGDPMPPLLGRGHGGGSVEARLVGGSLSLIAASIGTPWEIDTHGAILLFEDVGEAPYRLDRMLVQLRAAGKLDSLVGVGVGRLEDCSSQRYPEITAIDAILDVLAPIQARGVPIVTELPFGHCDPHLAWPVGGRARLDAARGRLEIS